MEEVKLHFCNRYTIEKLIVVDTLVKSQAFLSGSASILKQKITQSFINKKKGNRGFQDCSISNNKALTRHTMRHVSEQSWLFNVHMVLVFLCRRAVVLAALLLYNGPHSGFSEWQRTERNHGLGLRLPLSLVYLTRAQVHVELCTHIFSSIHVAEIVRTWLYVISPTPETAQKWKESLRTVKLVRGKQRSVGDTYLLCCYQVKSPPGLQK